MHVWVAEHVTLCGLPSRLAMVAFAGLLATLVLHAWARVGALAAMCVTMVVALLGRSLVRAANTLFAMMSDNPDAICDEAFVHVALEAGLQARGDGKALSSRSTELAHAKCLVGS